MGGPEDEVNYLFGEGKLAINDLSVYERQTSGADSRLSDYDMRMELAERQRPSERPKKRKVISADPGSLLDSLEEPEDEEDLADGW